MIRIAGVNVDSNKHARFALTVVKGIGKTNVKELLLKLNIGFDTKLDDLSEDQLVLLRNQVDTYLIEADLKRFNQTNIKRLIDINSHRGLRHKANLPVRGQTTKTNSRTVRGNKRLTGGSGKIKAK